MAVPTLVGMMLDRGTKSEDQFKIAHQLESVGAEISFEVGIQLVEIHAKCLKKDLPLVIRLIAEQLRTPAFAPAEFAKAQQQAAFGELAAVARKYRMRGRDEAFDRAVIFPQGHPNRPAATEEMIAAVKSAKLEDLKRFHREHYGPAHLTLIVVGDIDVHALQAEVGKGFSGWTGGSRLSARRRAGRRRGARTRNPSPCRAKRVSRWCSERRPGLRYRDPDALALRVGTAILGSGFTSRLMAHRARQGGPDLRRRRRYGE